MCEPEPWWFPPINRVGIAAIRGEEGLPTVADFDAMMRVFEAMGAGADRHGFLFHLQCNDVRRELVDALAHPGVPLQERPPSDSEA